MLPLRRQILRVARVVDVVAVYEFGWSYGSLDGRISELNNAKNGLGLVFTADVDGFLVSFERNLNNSAASVLSIFWCQNLMRP